jgi:hypothetical protein
MNNVSPEEWTPKDVGEELIEAIGWAFRAGGRVGPAGFGSGMPQIMMTHMERIAEQWPLLDDQDAAPRRKFYTPAQISRMERVLFWQTRYLMESPIIAAALSTWLFCKIKKGARYGDVLKRQGVARATGSRQKDRALAMIAIGLTRDQIARGEH